MNINPQNTVSGLGAFHQGASVGKTGAAGGAAVKPDGAPDTSSVTVVQNDVLAGIGDVAVSSAVEADIGFNDDIAQLFSGYAFTQDEIPPLTLER